MEQPSIVIETREVAHAETSVAEGTDSELDYSTEFSEPLSASLTAPTIPEDCKGIGDQVGTQPEEPAINEEGDREGLSIAWGSVVEIPDSALIELTLKYLDPENKLTGSSVAVLDRLEGAYNRVHIIQLSDGKKVVVRVPGRGIRGVWTDDDALALRSQALTLKYIKENTELPIPEVLGYDTAHSNAIGHPYVIMSFLDGKRVCDVWDGERYGYTLELKRLTILNNMAKAISELRHLSFMKDGMLYFDKDDEAASCPTIGPIYMPDIVSPNAKPFFHPASDSSYKFYKNKLAKWWKNLDKDVDDAKEYQQTGLYYILSLMVEFIPSAPIWTNNSDEPETFVLTPGDWDHQNILIDDNLNVTGILDWDNVGTQNRFQGWASQPIWLQADYSIGYAWEGEIGNSPEDLERYRKAYTTYMEEACEGEGDCRFTGKSHLFDALLDALNSDTEEETEHFVGKILSAILPRTNISNYILRIGERGFAAGEGAQMMKKLKELFTCEPGPDDRFSF